MSVTIRRIGYSQVEPNLLSGIVEGRILDQLPVDTTTMGTVIENGRFAKYDYATGKVNLTGDGEWMLIYNEEEHYDERKPYHKDFALIADEFTDGVITPRLIMTEVGDIMTLNAFGAANTAHNVQISAASSVTLAKGNYLTVANTGYLAKADAKPASGMCWKVVAETTMPDTQTAVKIQRIQ